jgi:hypothetical protein
VRNFISEREQNGPKTSLSPVSGNRKAHSTPLAAAAIHSRPNYALLFGGIRIKRLKVVLSLRLSRQGAKVQSLGS